MSLIQQALERTSRAQETRTAVPARSPKLWNRDPMGAALEQELIRVQESYVARRNLYWKVALGILIVFSLIAFFTVVPRHGARTISPKPPVAVAVPQVPVKIYGGTLYRLTGITDVGGDAIAVINGRLLSEGDALDAQATIKKIGDGEVRVDVRGREMKLVL
jgi:hypothetical protein